MSDTQAIRQATVPVDSTEHHYTKRATFRRGWRRFTRQGRRVLAMVSHAQGWTLVVATKGSTAVAP